ncbi:unnamed protein product [Xylocopa violacea]|uniref:Phosphate carrier protein, mitochondrial n=1 Tax=Xylocopa violacea TaxID=135666 RepID=A0ABP1NA55_XYLVO
MWTSILDVAKMNPFGTPFVTAKCQGQNELTQALVKNRHIAAASVDSGDSCEFGSNKYFMLCGLGGILSCGITHTMVTPLDLVKCRIQVNPAKYKSVFNGFKVTVAEDGTRGLVKGWAPTFFGYSIQGMFKFGLYEVFKVYYSALAGEEMAYEYRTSLYLVSSASAEFFADIGLAPLEASKFYIQYKIQLFFCSSTLFLLILTFASSCPILHMLSKFKLHQDLPIH